MVAVWLIAGDSLKERSPFFIQNHEEIQFSQLKKWIYFSKWLKYEQMFMRLSVKFEEQQMKHCHYEKYKYN